ncbi:MAG TPA: hypothetical protein VHI52_18970, partial [Verrucomicrobiae bacterium]|nr:hypothetical protein [Verrucomicrobiae bacterium]
PNVLGLPTTLMQYLVLGFGVIGTVFGFAVLRLGKLNRRARPLFVGLVVPVSVLYPVVIATASGAVGHFQSIYLLTSAVGALLFVVACFSIWFYTSEVVGTDLLSVLKK